MATKPKRKRSYQRHGLRALDAALEKVEGRDWVEELGPVGDALSAWRQGLIDDLGGEPSTAQLAMIDLACRSYLMLEHIDQWMLKNSLINKRSRKLHPVVGQRMRVADSLAKYLGMLGLERHEPKGVSLNEYIEERYGNGDVDGDT